MTWFWAATASTLSRPLQRKASPTYISFTAHNSVSSILDMHIAVFSEKYYNDEVDSKKSNRS